DVEHLSYRDLILTNSTEMSFARRDRPVPIQIDGVGRCVRLADGSVLIAARSTSFVDRLIRVTPLGTTEVLLELQGSASDVAFEAGIAVSPHDPYAAVAVSQPSGVVGNESVALIRTDGFNVPGALGSAIGATTPNNLEVDFDSMVFLQGALFYGDAATILHRFDLATQTVSTLVFPPSGGLTPIMIDESCAPAEGGSAFAIGAGQSATNKDVYVVHADGTVVNVTNAPTSYDDARWGDPDGGQLAMTPDGSKVSYMAFYQGDCELFVLDVPSLLPAAHVTNATQFVNSIDTVVGLGFATTGDLVFVSGHDELTMDVYLAPATTTGLVSQITNLSGTSGTIAPIFGFGSTLTHEMRFNMPGSRLHVLDDAVGARRLQVIDPAGGSVGLEIGVLQKTAAAGAGGAIIVDTTPAGTLRLRCLGDQPGTPLVAVWQSAGPATLMASAHAAADGANAFLVAAAAGVTLVVCPVGAPLIATPLAFTDLSPTVGFDAQGRVLVTERHVGNNTVSLHRFDAATQVWTLVAGPITNAFEGHFIR
ncbi:MAG: hypothetical protein KDB53_09430, partial [Planctomycetes bacterium]|nr:hypothetical protein [Planctomycetota bacterium]